MRTKTLLLTAALGLVGVASSMAQVYSVNAVGYVNISIPTDANNLTYRIIANPLNGTNNLLSTVIPTVPDATQLYFFRNGGFEIYTYLGGWLSDSTWNPGEAAFIEVPAGAPNPTTVTFVGEVPQGHLVNAIPAGVGGASGYSLRASIVPQSGGLTSVLGLTPQDGDQIYQFGAGGYAISTYLGGWLSGEPTVAVGEGFFYENNGAALNWVRDFSVSP